MMSFSSLAQTQQPSAACTTQECAAQQKNCQTPKAPCKAKNPKADPFAGLTLSESQKTQLNALKAKRAEARAEKMQARKADMRLNDSARIANRRQYLEEVKEIIGPDQYVMYLESTPPGDTPDTTRPSPKTPATQRASATHQRHPRPTAPTLSTAQPKQPRPRPNDESF